MTRVPGFLGPLQSLTTTITTTSMDDAGARAATGGAARASGRKLARFSVQDQLETNWCWAAVSTSVARYFGANTWTQCKLASAELNLRCCGSGKPGKTERSDKRECNQEWSLDAPLSRVGHLKQMLDSGISFAQIQREIDEGRPLCCRVEWSTRRGHFVAIGGWSSADGTQYVAVHDPWYGVTVETPYTEFRDAYRQPGTRWTHSYLILGMAPARGKQAKSRVPTGGPTNGPRGRNAAAARRRSSKWQ